MSETLLPEKGEQNTDLNKLEAILEQFSITIAEANDLVELEGHNFVIFADDSGSMQASALSKEEMNNAAKEEKEVEERTRWNEVENACAMIVEMANCFNPRGVDLYFVNRRSRQKVKSMDDEEFKSAFCAGPEGTSQMGRRLLAVGERAVKRMGREAPILMFILTDGCTDDQDEFKDNIKKLMEMKDSGKGNFKLQLMACTSTESDAEWLTALESRFDAVDCIDDYKVELKQVMRAGKTKSFTRGDWVLKAMLGPISKKHDALDESRGAAGSAGCCSSCVVS